MLRSPIVELATLLLLAVGAALFLEGLPYFAAPGAVRRYLEAIGGMSDAALRATGLAMMTVGLLLAYLATR